MSADTIAIPEPVLIDVDLFDPHPENPNEESDAMFAELVEGIKKYGFLEPVLADPKEGGRYEILAGEHRWRAGKVLGMPQIPAHLIPQDDEDAARALLIRHNAVRGKINPAKFTRMFNALANRYGEAAVRRMTGLSEESEFRRLYKDVRKTLPAEMKHRLDQAKEEMKDVDDLARVLQRIMSEHGGDLDTSFIVFSFGGREHVMVQAEPRTWKNLQRIIVEARDEGVDLNRRLNQLLEAYVPF